VALELTLSETDDLYYTHNFRPKNKRFIVIAN